MSIFLQTVIWIISSVSLLMIADKLHMSKTVIKNSDFLPSDYAGVFPFDSVLQKTEAEIVCKNVVIILNRTGNEWRDLSWDEYKSEREKDGNFTQGEKRYFDEVIEYVHPERIRLFSKAYKKVI